MVFSLIWGEKWRRSKHAHASYPGLSFRAPGFSPYVGGGKKGEFRDWTKCDTGLRLTFLPNSRADSLLAVNAVPFYHILWEVILILDNKIGKVWPR